MYDLSRCLVGVCYAQKILCNLGCFVDVVWYNWCRDSFWGKCWVSARNTHSNCIGWCFGYVLVARSKVFIVTASEIIYVSLFIFITTILFNKFGYSSTIYSYVFSSIIHMIIVIISYKLTVK